MTTATRPTRRLRSVFFLTFTLCALAALTGCPIFWGHDHEHEHEDHERSQDHEHREERHDENDHDRRN